jgi:hypothetical protein
VAVAARKKASRSRRRLFEFLPQNKKASPRPNARLRAEMGWLRMVKAVSSAKGIVMRADFFLIRSMPRVKEAKANKSPSERVIPPPMVVQEIYSGLKA